MTLIEKTLKSFTDKFGQFYLKAFNSGKFFHVNGTSDNQATIDFEAGKDNESTTSEDIKAFITQALQEQDRESRRAGMKEVLLKVKGNLERFKDKPSLGYTFDVKYNLNSIEDYAKQHNIDLHEN